MIRRISIERIFWFGFSFSGFLMILINQYYVKSNWVIPVTSYMVVGIVGYFSLRLFKKHGEIKNALQK